MHNGAVTESFTERFAAGLAGYGDRPCLQFDGRWYSGDEVAGYGRRVGELLADVDPAAPIGLVVRNRYPHAAAVIGAVAAGRPVVMIYSFQSPEAVAADITRADVAAVLADA